MDKKVVVTGCSGFIGFHLSNSLLEADKQVIGIDSLNSAYDVKLKQKRLEKLDKNNNFTFFNNNLSQEDSLNEIKKYEISTIYHMAARAGVRQSFLDPQSYIEDNTYATANVANFCKEIEIPEIILASTSSIYGDSGESLMVEEKDEKSFTYIADVVDALRRMSGLENSHTFNVGSNITVSLNEVIKLIEEFSGKNANIENLERAYKDPDVVRPNLEKINEAIGWEPTTKIQEGIEKTVSWYKENEDYLKDLVYVNE